MNKEPVLFDFNASSGVATLTFNRPAKYNALDEDMAAAFYETVKELSNKKDVRCIVLRGAGKAFLAGGDISAFAAEPDRADQSLQRILRHMHPALMMLQNIDPPVIAVVHGPAAGAGLSIVLSADYAISNQSAQFILAYDKLATVPDCGGTWFLRNKLGPRAAFALMLKGENLTAQEAKDMGIVNEVIEDSAFEDRINAFVHKIASGPTRAFGLFKHLMANDLPLAAQLEAEKAAFMEATYTDDFKNAVSNFQSKKPTLFIGH